MNPPKGYYRQLLKNDCPSVRIAFTHTPIIGCKTIDMKPVLEILDKSSDVHAKCTKIKRLFLMKNGRTIEKIKNDQSS